MQKNAKSSLKGVDFNIQNVFLAEHLPDIYCFSLPDNELFMILQQYNDKRCAFLFHVLLFASCCIFSTVNKAH